MPTYTLTLEIEAILNAMVHSNGNKLIRARAGTGKSTVIGKSVDVLIEHNSNLEILVCAFNKPVALEMQKRLEQAGHKDFHKVSASTIHSMGFGLVRSAFNPQVDVNKVRKIVDQMIEQKRTDPDFLKQYKFQICKFVGLAKLSGVGFFDGMTIKDNHVWYGIADHYDINGFDDTTQLDAMVEIA